MELIKAERIAKELIKKYLGNSKHYWSFHWAKGKRVFGTCRYSRFTHQIRLSRHLTKLNEESRVINTILHEIAHALDYEERGFSNHDYNWVRIAKSIGCDGKRCYDSDKVNKPVSKYTLICGGCGSKVRKHRIPKYDLACSSCCKEHNNGEYSDDYKFEIIKNY